MTEPNRPSPRPTAAHPRMPRRRVAAALCMALALASPACTVHEHTVGLGPSGIGEDSVRQYFWFFGLFRLNEVDTERMADDLSSYRIRTETAFSDLLLMPILAPLTLTSRTVTVSR